MRWERSDCREWVSSVALPTNPIVFVVDADEAVRQWLERVIRMEGWQPATFASASEFLTHPRVVVPSCLILDLSLPCRDGLDLQRRVATEWTGCCMPIIFITRYSDVATTVQAMKAGAAEFLVKPFSDNVLLTAVRQALDDSRTALYDETKRRALWCRYQTLSRREVQVMGLVVSGLSNKEVGYELGISEVTVKAHRGKVMQKMGPDSFADLVKMAGKLHLDDGLTSELGATGQR